MVYIDSNVWIYAVGSSQDDAKRSRAKEVVRSNQIAGSLQVVNEVCRVLLRKERISEEGVRAIVHGFYKNCLVVQLDEVDVIEASQLRSEYRLSFWDSLHVAAALKAGVPTLYSEDMQDGLVVRGKLKIENPFR